MLHIAIVRKVREGREAEFEAKVSDFFHASQDAPGVTGTCLVRPGSGSAGREYGILRSFASEAEMQAFYESPSFKDWIDSVRPLVEGEPVRRNLHGLEAFFRDPPPPRWKIAVLTWLGVCPAAYIFGAAVPAVTGPLGRLPTVLLVSAFVVASLAWIVMPLLTKAFAKWLHSPKA